MNKVAVVSGRVDADLATQLNFLAERLDRPRGWIVGRAVAEFVAAEMALLNSLDEAERQIDDGEYLSQADMEAWAKARRSADSAE